MKKLLWLVVGTVAGYFVARRFAATPRGGEFFADLDARAREFGEAVASSYHERQAELRAAIGTPDESHRN